MLTRNGGYRVFDITEFLPGRKIPDDFFALGVTGPWYFMPADWEAPDWGGSVVALYRGFPFAYSPGFETLEEALAAAEEWEASQPEREAREEAFMEVFRDVPYVGGR